MGGTYVVVINTRSEELAKSCDSIISEEQVTVLEVFHHHPIEPPTSIKVKAARRPYKVVDGDRRLRKGVTIIINLTSESYILLHPVQNGLGSLVTELVLSTINHQVLAKVMASSLADLIAKGKSSMARQKLANSAWLRYKLELRQKRLRVFPRIDFGPKVYSRKDPKLRNPSPPSLQI